MHCDAQCGGFFVVNRPLLKLGFNNNNNIKTTTKSNGKIYDPEAKVRASNYN